MANYKVDNYNGNQTESAVDATLWCTEAVTAGQWIASHFSDATNPGGTQGESYRIADSDEEKYDIVGVATQTTTAAGYVKVRIKGIYEDASVTSGASVAIGDKLAISATAGMAEEYAGTDPLLRVIGVCLSTPASSTADVLIYTHPRFISI